MNYWGYCWRWWCWKIACWRRWCCLGYFLMSYRYGWSKVVCVCYKRWCCFWYDYEFYLEFFMFDRLDFFVNYNFFDFFIFIGVGRIDFIVWNVVVVVLIELFFRDIEGVGFKEIFCLGCDEYLLFFNNGIGFSLKEVFFIFTWGKGKRVLYKIFFVINLWFLLMLGRDLYLRIYFVRFFEWEDCLVILKWRYVFFRYMYWFCVMIWFYNWFCYSCIG